MKHHVSGVNMQPHIAPWTFKSYPGLFFVKHAWHCIHLPFQVSDHYLHFEPAGGRWGWNTLPPPVNPWIRGVQGWDCVLSVHCLSVLVSSFSVTFMGLCLCHQFSCSSLKAFLKYLALGNTTTRDLCIKLHAYKSLMPAANCISSSTLWCNKTLPLLPTYWTASQVIENMFIIEP
jgi:hypothetical protein